MASISSLFSELQTLQSSLTPELCGERLGSEIFIEGHVLLAILFHVHDTRRPTNPATKEEPALPIRLLPIALQFALVDPLVVTELQPVDPSLLTLARRLRGSPVENAHARHFDRLVEADRLFQRNFIGGHLQRQPA